MIGSYFVFNSSFSEICILYTTDPMQFSGRPSICFSILEAVCSFTGFIWSIGSPVWGQEQAIGSNLGPAGQLIGKNLGSAGPKSVNREEFRVYWAQVS